MQTARTMPRKNSFVATSPGATLNSRWKATDWKARVSTFADDGLLTLDYGLVVNLPSGEQFQMTIQRSTR